MNDESAPEVPGTDGWVDPHAHTEFGLEAIPGPTEFGGAPPPPAKDTVEAGTAMALLSHVSVLLGMPLFIIPMMQRDNEFALHHAKAAAVNFIFFIVAAMLTVVTCGIAFPLIFVVYIPMIVGCVNAVNGQRAGGWAWGGAGEKMFPNVTVKDDPKQLR